MKTLKCWDKKLQSQKSEIPGKCQKKQTFATVLLNLLQYQTKYEEKNIIYMIFFLVYYWKTPYSSLCEKPNKFISIKCLIVFNVLREHAYYITSSEN